MAAWIPAAIGAAGSLLGGILGNSAQAKANKANIALARENRSWEEMMSNTAYTRATADMKNAGINPMLAVSQGGASTPSVSAPTVQPKTSFAEGVNSAANKAMQIAQLQLLQEQTRKAKEDANQAEITTDDMENERGLTGGPDIYYTRKSDEARTAEYARQLAGLKLTEQEATNAIKKIEQAIQEETFGFNVASAKTRAQLLDQEVSLNQVRMILMRLDIPEKEAMAKWFESVGAASPLTKAIMSIGQWLKMILGK